MTAIEKIKQISNRKLGPYFLKVKDLEEGRFREEINFRLYASLDNELSLKPLATGKYFSGRNHNSPWVEVTHFVDLVFPEGTSRNIREDGLEAELFQRFGDLLPPGSHIMVAYTHHRESRRGLEINIPAPATPLGRILWDIGCTWFKDWYIAEGFTEGDVKLQGNIPPGETYREKQVQEIKNELETYLETGAEESDIHQNARNRAQQILYEIEENPE